MLLGHRRIHSSAFICNKEIIGEESLEAAASRVAGSRENTGKARRTEFVEVRSEG